MKLQNEFEFIKGQFREHLEEIKDYAPKLKASGNYKDFEIRLAWDCIRAFVGSGTVCLWYDKYGCKDSHITTAGKKALKEQCFAKCNFITHKHFGLEKGANTMTFEQIKKDIRNCGLSQYFDKDGNLISVFEHWNGTYDVIVSSGGTSLRTSNVIARHENCDVQDMLNILGIS